MEYNKLIFVAQTGTCREAIPPVSWEILPCGIRWRFPENIQVLTKYVGDELEILDPYGGALPAYGLCYETLRKSIKKTCEKI